MKATQNGNLNPIPNCIVTIPGAGTDGGVGVIPLNNLPDISDSKNAIYNNEAVPGRSVPFYIYSHSGDRHINIQFHFFIINAGDGTQNLQYLRMLQSALYPRDGNSIGAPYQPPPICTFQCGILLATQPLCMVLESYNVKFDTKVAWDEDTYCPYRFDVETSWLVVYSSDDLPNQDRIISSGR